MLENTPSYRIIDVYLCSIGRHFRLSPECKMVLSRDAAETEILLSYKSESDVFVYSVFRGPVGFIRGEASAEDLNNAASILLKYGKKNETGANIVRVSGAVNTEFEVFKPADDEMIEKFRAKWKKPERLSPAE